MQSLEDIKKRRTSVKSISKTTKAMELVSIAKTKKYSKKIVGVNEFKNSVYEIISELLKSKDASESSLFSKNENQKGRKLWIVITSDMGLCGAYNSNIIKKLQSMNPGTNDLFFVKGARGIGQIKNRMMIEPTKVWERYNEDELSSLSREFSKEVMELIEDKKVTEVNIISTKYINQITTEAIATKLFPLDKETFANTTRRTRDRNQQLEFEPNARTVLEGLVPQYLTATFIALLTESTLSEYSSRRAAMENANTNGQDLMEQLEIDYNKVRQSKITQEINEIISGAELE